ncbi:hypothetical protein [Medusavirus stheno T3]|uniref:Uncharacterized protein n=1 Tax=Medusavirus stheno T3 TaxID=3069717 RepID=A0A7S7YEY0_9VIRU|nr:hypothetical protein QKU73_gp222 [Acanthamoeba castellanii medusavirus]QPB44553.1 hypothetical protein [Medusavirus stheno T3]
MSSQWKNVRVTYGYQGKQVTEDLYLTVDLDGNQIVTLPTAGILLASQPGQSCNIATLRSDAIAKFQSLGAH